MLAQRFLIAYLKRLGPGLDTARSGDDAYQQPFVDTQTGTNLLALIPGRIWDFDWSPDSKFVAFSRGPESDGDLTKKGTFQAACEIVGVYAKDWNICAVSAKHTGILDLSKATDAEFVQLTTSGASNKEPAWFRPGR